MTPRDVTPAGSHDEVQLLLPGYVTQRLSDEERALVQAHLRYCSECRADLAWDTRLASDAPPLPASLDAEHALQRMMLRLPPARPTAPAHPLGTRVKDALRSAGWLPWAMALPALLLTLTLLRPDAPLEYRALASGAAQPTANVVVVFGPNVRIDAVQQVLRTHGARIVDGPTDSGAYVLAVPPGQQAATLQALKADAHVQLAESLLPAQP